MSDAPPDFSGKPDEFLAWTEAHPSPKRNPHWCPRHWMPCPVDGLNGIMATVLMAGESFALLPPDVIRHDAINSWWANVGTPACCQFGDDKMAKLWDRVRLLMGDEICKAPPPKDAGRFVCCFDTGHDGPHEWELPPHSIFE